MKLIVDIDENDYKIIKNNYENGFTYKPFGIIANGTALPDNPTNGDVIKAMFPQFDVNEEWKATRRFEFQSEECIEITGIATSEWWNAPYKR